MTNDLMARELVTEPFRLMDEEGRPIHDKVFIPQLVHRAACSGGAHVPDVPPPIDVAVRSDIARRASFASAIVSGARLSCCLPTDNTVGSKIVRAMLTSIASKKQEPYRNC